MEWTEWTGEDVARAYGESRPALRAALDYLADRPGKKEWFFAAHRKRRPDGSLVLGYFGYVMPAEKAAWVRKASGRE